jgi:hypothetical protein
LLISIWRKQNLKIISLHFCIHKILCWKYILSERVFNWMLTNCKWPPLASLFIDTICLAVHRIVCIHLIPPISLYILFRARATDINPVFLFSGWSKSLFCTYVNYFDVNKPLDRSVKPSSGLKAFQCHCLDFIRIPLEWERMGVHKAKTCS